MKGLKSLVVKDLPASWQHHVKAKILKAMELPLRHTGYASLKVAGFHSQAYD